MLETVRGHPSNLADSGIGSLVVYEVFGLKIQFDRPAFIVEVLERRLWSVVLHFD